MRVMLVTGSSGLIGSEVVSYFAGRGWAVHGIDNNMRADFFGPAGDTRWNQKRLSERFPAFVHNDLDLRDRSAVGALVSAIRPTAIVHCAAQPSHDLAASRPFDDFDVNANGTLNLLEAARHTCAEAPFVHFSTNKVYGDAPNELALTELATRWEYADPAYRKGIPEDFRIDRSKHSLFGASKLAADILVQEYGRYFGMPTCCLRGGCLTGPNHSSVELHGFLSFLVKCNVKQKEYTIFGYQGKQVRDNIHSYDVACLVERFIETPGSAEVFNLGGGKDNSISILEAIDAVSAISGKRMHYRYVDQPRSGDHICYYSDLSRTRARFPRWQVTRGLDRILMEIYEGWVERS